MVLVERDFELFKWLNGFGFATVEQVANWMGVGLHVARARLRKLEGEGLLVRERLFFRGGAIVQVTKAGAAVASDDLKLVRNFNLSQFSHDSQLIDLSLKLVKENPGSWFWSARRIRHDLSIGGAGEKGHVADGYLVLENGNRYAVELELTRKSKSRVKKILGRFQTDFDIKGVWYFCAPDVVGFMKDQIGDDDLFKVEEWTGLDDGAKK